jgi:chromosome segregation ATPase
MKICLAQNVSIFFLKDGSIIQGKVVNENQHRIFLKTDQGTIKIIPSDIIGREDSAKKGDLTFMSERLEYLQGNVTHLTGKVSHWNDSLKTVVDDLQVLFENLEVLQNEFEIDLLRLYSESREQNKKMDYVQDDLVNQRVGIAGNKQEVGTLEDSLVMLNKSYSQIKQKLDITSNQSYLLTGNLSSFKKDIIASKDNQKMQQNQIDMMSGALANQIQEVTRVQSSFNSIENMIKNNGLEIKNNATKIELKTSELSIEINNTVTDLNKKLDIINKTIENSDKNNIKNHKDLKVEVGNLKNDFDIMSNKVLDVTRDLKASNEKISRLDDLISKLDNNMIKVESSIKDMNIKISKIDSKVLSLDKKIDLLPTESK